MEEGRGEWKRIEESWDIMSLCAFSFCTCLQNSLFYRWMELDVRGLPVLQLIAELRRALPSIAGYFIGFDEEMSEQ